MDLTTLSAEWLVLKSQEKEIIESRRKVEDKLFSLIGLPQNLNSTKHIDHDFYDIKVTGRAVKKVDADLLQELAQENDLSDQLSYLFRWKPEVNTKNWNTADDRTKNFLADAITTTPSRPSFSITTKEE